ncbi:MAG: hypothetical protein LQ340_001249 [Diploschistes diacapsis]|nr:MAG: hypothetical protein LQ340_001249 [Diploschistes diacapsis]
MKVYLVFGTENVSALFANSQYLARDNLTRQAFYNSSARTKPTKDGNEDVKIPDGRKRTARRIAGSDGEEAARISRKLHDMQHLYLSQPAEIKVITEKFSQVFQEQLRVLFGSVPENVAQPDAGTRVGEPERTVHLFQMLKRTMFIASTVALMGTRILELSPEVVEDYWAYDEAFLLGLPELMYPAGSSARDKLLDAVKRYVEAAHDAGLDSQENEAVWDRNSGCRLFRESLKEMEARGIAHEDQAGALLSLVWATASNSIPLTGWILSTLLEDPSLLVELRDELSTAVTSESDAMLNLTEPAGTATFDMARLNSLPLLNSIYHECLRLRTSVTVTRRLTADIKIGGYTLRKGNFVMAPSYLAHNDSIAWDDGNGHSAQSFLAKRFVKSTRSNDSLAPETFFPYGGGNAICPGRFFSKQQILVAVAIAVLGLDMELQSYVGMDGKKERDMAPMPDQRYAGGGVMPPEGDWILSWKRR